MGHKKLALILFALLMFAVASPVQADSPTVSGLSKQLVCQCGCNMVLANCSHAECGVRESMVSLIGQQIANGQSQEQIIGLFVSQYGEQVLASLPKKGFNLTAWILPIVGLLGGAGVVYLLVTGWVNRGRRAQVRVPIDGNDTDAGYASRVEKELQEFGEGGFR